MQKTSTVALTGAHPRLSYYVRWSRQLLVNRQELVAFLLLLLTGAILGLRTDTFLTSQNLFNIARNFSWIAVAAFGESMVIIIGGIDLSVGSVMALAGFTAAVALKAGLPVPVAVIAGLVAGGWIGWINGILVGRMHLPPFIVTLGTLSIARGLVFGFTGGEPIRDLPAAFRSMGQHELLLGGWALPLPVLYMLLLAALMSVLLNLTVFGRYTYILGSNERALRVAGVQTDRLKVAVYTLCGLLTALSGLLMTAKLGVAAPTAAAGYELDIIAAAVIGGTSLFGGEGSVSGVLLGAALMQVLRNGLVLLGVPAHWQNAAIGVLILVVILLDYWRRQRTQP